MKKLMLMTAIVAAVALLIFPGAASARTWNSRTLVTFAGPVTVSGRILPAGTYTFEVMNKMGYNHVVEIFNKDGDKLVTTVLALPDYRSTPNDKTVIKLSERPVGTPQAMSEWFYAGERVGDEFAGH